MSTKEDWPRPYQGQKFRDNYDQIFRKGKPTLVDQYHPDTVRLRDHGKNSKKRKP